jgi:hypothetical protein
MDGSLQANCPADSEPGGLAMPWFPDCISAAALNQSWLAGRYARIETVASTLPAGGRW